MYEYEDSALDKTLARYRKEHKGRHICYPCFDATEGGKRKACEIFAKSSKHGADEVTFVEGIDCYYVVAAFRDGDVAADMASEGMKYPGLKSYRTFEEGTFLSGFFDLCAYGELPFGRKNVARFDVSAWTFGQKSQKSDIPILKLGNDFTP